MDDPLRSNRYRELEFDKFSRLTRPDQVAAGAGLAGEVTDLLVLCHGWNNDIGEARGLYRDLMVSIEIQRTAGHEGELDDRTLGVLGILWPSKRFADEELVPGGAAGIDDPDSSLSDDLHAMADTFATPDAAEKLAKAAALVPRLELSPAARGRYAELLRSLVNPDAGDDEDAGSDFFTLDGQELYRRVDDPQLGDPDLLMPIEPDGTGGALDIPASGALGEATGGAAGVLSALLSPARALLNLVTYYEMKDRAGQVGRAFGPLLAEHLIGRTRVHLAGHSFGGRLATVAAMDAPKGGIASLSLLQAAFSHYGFAQNWEPGQNGAFRAVVAEGKVRGPIIVTHTRRDRAVGIAYAIASRVAGQVASSIGDASSRFGGLGGNGAQRTPEVAAARLLAVDLPYVFSGAPVHNLLADDFVSGHGDVRNRPVAHALLAAMAAGG